MALTIRRHNGRGVVAATGLAKVISGNIKDNLTIAISGGGARYDFSSHTMYLPGIPGDDLDPETLREFRAFLQHEAFERGFSTWTTDSRYRLNASSGLHNLINALNDVRINREGGKTYPGAMLNIKAVYRVLWKDLLERNQTEPLRKSVGAIAVMLAYIGEGTVTYEDVLREFPQLAKYMKVVEPWVRRMEEITATEDACIEASLEIYDALKKPQEHKPETAPDAVPVSVRGGETDDPEDDDFDGYVPGDEPLDESDVGEPSQKDAENGVETPEDTDTEGEPSEDGSGQESSTEDDSEPSEDPASKDGVGSDAPLGSGADTDVSDWPDEPLEDEAETDPDREQEALDRLVEQMFGGQEFKKRQEHEDMRSYRDRRKAKSYTYDDSKDHIYNPSTRTSDDVMSKSAYKREAQALTIRLRRALSIQTPRVQRRQTKGYVDETSIHRIVMGDEDVFKRPVKQEGDDIAAAVSWDESWSMGSKIGQVKMLCHAWNEAFATLGFPLAMYGWTSEEAPSYRLNNPNVYRWDTMKHRIYKEFSEDPHHPHVLRRLNKISATGCTPMGEGLSFAVEKLGQRRERRRVLFFMTDGKPSMRVNGDPEIHNNYIMTTLERAERAGIEVVGIGIGVELGHIFDRWVRIDNVKDLRGVASDQLVNVLREGKRTAITRARR